MDDMVYRQAAIEVIDAVFPVDPMKSEYAQGIACGAALAKTYVEQLPPTRPEPDIDEVTCESCEYSERYVDGLILCRRTKTSHRVSATSMCGKGRERRSDE